MHNWHFSCAYNTAWPQQTNLKYPKTIKKQYRETVPEYQKNKMKKTITSGCINFKKQGETYPKEF